MSSSPLQFVNAVTSPMPGAGAVHHIKLCRLGISAARLLYPWKRTLVGAAGMTEKCQDRSFSKLFDHALRTCL
jgi:hypothetical protein